jgi:hypothetical protein
MQADITTVTQRKDSVVVQFPDAEVLLAAFAWPTGVCPTKLTHDQPIANGSNGAAVRQQAEKSRRLGGFRGR